MKIIRFKLLVIFCLLYNVCLYSQDLGIYCKPLTFNDEIVNHSDRYTRSIESVIGRIESYPRIIEREKFVEITEILQEEVNLLLDLGQEVRSKFELARIGWILVSNFLEKPIQGKYILQIQVVNAQNNNALASIRLPSFEFLEEEVSDLPAFESKLENYLNQYLINDEFGVVEKSKYIRMTDELKEKGRIIDSLKLAMHEFPQKVIALAEVTKLLNMLYETGETDYFCDLFRIMEGSDIELSHAAKLALSQFEKKYKIENLITQSIEEIIEQYGLNIEDIGSSNDILLKAYLNESDIFTVADLIMAYSILNKKNISFVSFHRIALGRNSKN